MKFVKVSKKLDRPYKLLEINEILKKFLILTTFIIGFVILSCQASNMLNLNVRTLDGKSYKIWVSKDGSIADLKTEVYRAMGMPVETQRLIYLGTLLKNDREIASYNMQSETAVHLVEDPEAKAAILLQRHRRGAQLRRNLRQERQGQERQGLKKEDLLSVLKKIIEKLEKSVTTNRMLPYPTKLINFAPFEEARQLAENYALRRLAEEILAEEVKRGNPSVKVLPIYNNITLGNLLPKNPKNMIPNTNKMEDPIVMFLKRLHRGLSVLEGNKRGGAASELKYAIRQFKGTIQYLEAL